MPAPLPHLLLPHPPALCPPPPLRCPARVPLLLTFCSLLSTALSSHTCHGCAVNSTHLDDCRKGVGNEGTVRHGRQHAGRQQCQHEQYSSNPPGIRSHAAHLQRRSAPPSFSATQPNTRCESCPACPAPCAAIGSEPAPRHPPAPTCCRHAQGRSVSPPLTGRPEVGRQAGGEPSPNLTPAGPPPHCRCCRRRRTAQAHLAGWAG